MAFNLDRIADNLRRFGVKVVEVDGWQYRGYAQQDLIAYRGTLNHHTATNRAAFARSVVPTLGLLINGRSDLPGPLCNLAGARDGTIYVVATGVANHAGMGVAPGIPDNTGNHYFCGIEWESSGTYPYDWTVEQLAVMPLVNAALELSYMQSLTPAERLSLSHAEYSTVGKIDIAGYPGGMDRLRSQTNDIIAQLAGGSTPVKPTAPKPKPKPKEDTLSAAEVKQINDYTAALLLNGYTSGGEQKPSLRAILVENQRRITATNADTAALRSVVDQVAEAQGVSIDYAKVEAAAAAGAAKALAGGVDVDATITLKPSTANTEEGK